MTWKAVTEFAASNNLAIYKPYCGAHRLVQITTSDGQAVSWAGNRVKDVFTSLQAIVHQRELDKVSTDELIGQAAIAKSFI